MTERANQVRTRRPTIVVADVGSNKNRYSCEQSQTELIPSISGKSLGISTVPSMSLTIATPAVMTTKTTARATDSADVYLNESVTKDVSFTKVVPCAHKGKK